MEYLIDFILHMDHHLNELVMFFGVWTYVIMFLIVFAETGLVVTPFLPGDSLLFTLGALASVEGSPLQLEFLWLTLMVAGILGDAVNYKVGQMIGPKIFTSTTSRLFNKTHLVRTQSFYEKHGGFTIIVARFLPIIRTFAPFVAGIGQMRYPRFAVFNVAGAFLWVTFFLVAGYYFGTLPMVKKNFQLVILGIIFVSALPLFYEYVRQRRKDRLSLS